MGPVSAAAVIGGGLVSLGEKLIDHLFPDPAARDEAKLKLLLLERQGALEELKVSLSAITAESQSSDPWTSRARPSFLYVMYVLILGCIPVGLLHIVKPAAAASLSTGMASYLGGIPEPLWWLFGTGYLGYSTARGVDKWNEARKPRS